MNNNNDILLRTHGPYHRHKNTKKNRNMPRNAVDT